MTRLPTALPAHAHARPRPLRPARASGLPRLKCLPAWLAGLGLASALLLTGCGLTQDPAADLAAGKAAIAEGKWGAAQSSLKLVLEAQPENGEARHLLGKALAKTGDYAGAEAELRRALEAGRPEAEVLPELASALVLQGKGAQVLMQYGNTRLAETQADAQLKLHLAEAEAQGGNVDSALARVDEALRAVPKHASATLLGAGLRAAKGEMDAALAQVEALIADQPKLAEAHLLKGNLLANRLKPQKAADAEPVLAAYRQALSAQPDHVASHVAIMNLLMRLGDNDGVVKQWEALKQVAPQNRQTLTYEAVIADQKGDFKRVRELTQMLLRGAPNDARVLLLAGRAESRLNAPEQAEMHLAKAMQLMPNAALPRRLLAQVQVAGGQADKALLTLKPLLAASTPDAEALGISAQAHMLKGQVDQAQAALAQVAKLKPDNARVRTAMALVNLSKGQDAAAADRELSAAAAADSGVSADLALIAARMRQNDPAGALKAVDKLAAKQPDSPMPALLRGRVEMQRKDLAAARRHFNEALVKKPDFMPALAALASVDLAEHKPADAKARFQAVLAKDERHAGALLALAELSARTGGKPEEATELLQRAAQADPSDPALRLRLIDHLTAVGETKPALEAIQAGLNLQANSVDLIEREGRLHLATGNAQQAVNSFLKLTSLAPQSVKAHLMLADAQSAAKNSIGVTAAVSKAAELSPDSPEVLRAQFQLAMRDYKPDQALAVARKLQAKLPNQAAGWVLEANVEANRKNWPAALAALRKAVATPQPADSAQRLHAVLVASGATAEADKWRDDWRRRHPEDLGFIEYLGGIALQRGEYAQSETLLREVLKKAPERVPVLNNLAYVLAKQKKPGAVAAAEQAVALAPRALEVKDTYAMALAAEGQLPKAITVQSEVVAAAPDRPIYRLQLAKLQIDSGDRSSARSELTQLTKLGSNFAQQAEVSELMRKLDAN